MRLRAEHGRRRARSGAASRLDRRSCRATVRRTRCADLDAAVGRGDVERARRKSRDDCCIGRRTGGARPYWPPERLSSQVPAASPGHGAGLRRAGNDEGRARDSGGEPVRAGVRRAASAGSRLLPAKIGTGHSIAARPRTQSPAESVDRLGRAPRTGSRTCSTARDPVMRWCRRRFGAASDLSSSWAVGEVVADAGQRTWTELGQRSRAGRAAARG